MRDLQVYASDEDVARVFENTNFGSASPRQTIADTLLKVAAGYSTGKTSLACCLELGLIKKIGKIKFRGDYDLTKNGGYYLYDLFEDLVNSIK